MTKETWIDVADPDADGRILGQYRVIDDGRAELKLGERMAGTVAIVDGGPKLDLAPDFRPRDIEAIKRCCDGCNYQYGGTASALLACYAKCILVNGGYDAGS